MTEALRHPRRSWIRWRYLYFQPLTAVLRIVCVCVCVCVSVCLSVCLCVCVCKTLFASYVCAVRVYVCACVVNSRIEGVRCCVYRTHMVASSIEMYDGTHGTTEIGITLSRTIFHFHTRLLGS